MAGGKSVKKQLRGIALILISILFMIGYGNEVVFDLSLRWSAIICVMGIAGAIMTFLPDNKE